MPTAMSLSGRDCTVRLEVATSNIEDVRTLNLNQLFITLQHASSLDCRDGINQGIGSSTTC